MSIFNWFKKTEDIWNGPISIDQEFVMTEDDGGVYQIKILDQTDGSTNSKCFKVQAMGGNFEKIWVLERYLRSIILDTYTPIEIRGKK